MQLGKRSMAFAVVALVALATLAASSLADNSLSVTRPQELVEMFGNGRIEEQPSLFGMPEYGRSLRGLVYWPENQEDQFACEPFRSHPARRDGIPIVYLVKRGQCTFVTKVRNAQEAGAIAVIVVNDLNGNLPHMASDGTAAPVEIPSMIINRRDGEIISDYATAHNSTAIEVSIEFGLPTSDVVDFTLWTSAMDSMSKEFKHSFIPVAKAIQDKSRFHAHYFFVDGTAYGCHLEGEYCGNQCTNMGRYCAVDPDQDLSKGSSGSDVVQENTRQMCLFRLADSKGRTDIWWNYVDQFETLCADKNDVSEECFRRAMEHVSDVTANEVLKCVNDAGGVGDNIDSENSVIEEEINQRIDNGVYIMPTFLVNNVSYYGGLSCPMPLDISHCGVLSTICSAYNSDDQKPAICAPSKGCEMGKTRDACDQCVAIGSPNFINDASLCTHQSGVSLGTVIALIVLFVSVLIAVAFVYHRHSKSQMRDELKNIMSQYVPLGEPSEGSRLVPTV